MVVRTRIRAFFRQLVLLILAGASIAYFGFHAVNGDHGIMAQRQYDDQKRDLSAQLADLRAKRTALERRVALLKNDALDPDVLEDKARNLLGMVHPNDVVVLLPRN
ncbi:FtsB family cell division protein [Labrys wisconsinensis]|uniref:Cell division protein FtsB n=1 Tax=Labrys wisconsinensis TaxID=425677 RepID=A0ABU0J2D3_9HYPH|nr:septum formation initiator family protein [Labrys wisconsinensis]MDQ0468416.1 cell division protein FtsB [Labrys wisconsinensis]